MPRLSIIIPALGPIESLEATLVSVLEHRPQHAEVMVALGIPYDDPYDLSGEVTFVDALASPSLIGCVLAGIERSGGPIVHVLASGSEVEEGWADYALRHFDESPVAAVAPRLRVRNEDRDICSCGVGYSAGGMRRQIVATNAKNEKQSPLDVLGPEFTAAFYRRSALESVGGFACHLGDDLADVDLALRLNHAGFRAVYEPACHVQVRPAARPSVGPLRGAIHEERLFLRNLPAAGWLRGLCWHLPLVAARCVQTRSPATQLFGRLLAYVQLGHYLGHHRRLRMLEESPAIVEFDPAALEARSLHDDPLAEPHSEAA